MTDVLWKEARLAPADGITFSGKATEGAPTQRRNRRHEVLRCGQTFLSFVSGRRLPPISGGVYERSAPIHFAAAHPTP